MTTTTTSGAAGVTAIAALEQPLRRRLFALLRARDHWTTRDEAAEALGIGRSVAAFHLDKLVEAGVADVAYERTSGRTGPGAGRPSKLYRPATDELAASVPERHYDLAAELLANAVAASVASALPIERCLHDVAAATGRQIGDAARQRRADVPGDLTTAVTETITEHGYEPELRAGEIALRNCPFHRLAQEQRALVCGMNLDFLDGLVEGLGAAGELDARLAPEDGYCCVRLRSS